MDSAHSSGSMQSSSGGDDDDYGAVDSSQTSGAFSAFLRGSNPPIHEQQTYQSSQLLFPSTTSPPGSLTVPSFLMESFLHSPQLMSLDVTTWPPLPSDSLKSLIPRRDPAPDNVPCCSTGLSNPPPVWKQIAPASATINPAPTGTIAAPPPSTDARAVAPARGPSSSSKKRSRASRRTPTTVLTTDTANFRQMVQEFTGIPSAPFSSLAFPTRPRTSSTAAFDILHAAAAAAASTTLPYRSSGSTVGGLGLLESSGLFQSLVKKSLNSPFSTGLSSCTGTGAVTATIPIGNGISSSTTPPPISSTTTATAIVHGLTNSPTVCTNGRSSTGSVANPNSTSTPGSSYGILSHQDLGNDPSDPQLQSPLMRFNNLGPRSLALPFQQAEGLPVLMALEGTSSSAAQWTDRSSNTLLTAVGASQIRRSNDGSGCNQTGQAGQRPMDFHGEKAEGRSAVASIGEGMADSTWICSLDN